MGRLRAVHDLSCLTPTGAALERVLSVAYPQDSIFKAIALVAHRRKFLLNAVRRVACRQEPTCRRTPVRLAAAMQPPSPR